MAGTEWTSAGVPAPLGGALAFDGVNDFVDVPLAANMTPGTGTFTYVTWANISSSAATSTLLMFGNLPVPRNVIEYTSLSDRVVFAVDGSAGGDGFEAIVNDPARGKWVMFVGVREADGSGTNYVKSFDGSIDLTANSGAPTTTADVSPASIGLNIARSTNGTRAMLASIADMRYYDHALTASEVQALYDVDIVPEPSSFVLVLLGVVGLPHCPDWIFASG